MATNLNYARAKTRARTTRAVHNNPGDYDQQQAPRRPLRGWRTEWDGEPFPVTVTKILADKEFQPAHTNQTGD